MTSGRLLLGQPAVQLFLEKLGIEADPFRELDEFKAACEQANPRYKGGRDLVRFQLEADETTWPSGVRQATMNLANKLGMTHGETPLIGEWDLIIALGGARRSPLHRACYATQSIIESRASGMLVIAGSTRKLYDPEHPEIMSPEQKQVQDFAPNAMTEYDLCVGTQSTIEKKYECWPGISITTICEENPRSGNDGVIDKVMSDLGNDQPLRVAAVTTRIYVISLELDMARAAKRHGWRNFAAAGHASDPEMVFNRTISTYLSECLTTCRKAAIAAAEV
ncbi:MAG: hypothetical protein NTW79_02715 [Candidatus Berkelbacteria bacterium]|nr:hypothetical protein [Candidatus Berkelbacteria bacterium]